MSACRLFPCARVVPWGTTRERPDTFSTPLTANRCKASARAGSTTTISRQPQPRPSSNDGGLLEEAAAHDAALRSSAGLRHNTEDFDMRAKHVFGRDACAARPWHLPRARNSPGLPTVTEIGKGTCCGRERCGSGGDGDGT